jgi:transposase-like protein
MEEQGNEDSPHRRRRGRYPKEFRSDAAALVIDQRRTIADVARQLGVVELEAPITHKIGAVSPTALEETPTLTRNTAPMSATTRTPRRGHPSAPNRP